MFIEIVEFNGKHLGQFFESIFPQILAFSEHIFQSQDRLRHIPLPILVRAFMGLLISHYMLEMFFGHVIPPEMSTHTVDYLVDIYLHGILAGNPQP
jgi:presenilin-like A22 family membrane protease